MPSLVRFLFIADAIVIAAAFLNFAIARHFGFEHPSFLRLNAESNLPTWYSSFQLALAGILFGCLAIREIRIDVRRWSICLPALLFIFLSLVETAMVHDRISDMLRPPSTAPVEGAVPATNAIAMIICAPLVILAVIVIAHLTRRYWVGRRSIAFKFLLGTGILLISAAGLEVLIDQVESLSLRRIENLLEEGGEMIGVTIVIWSAVELLAAERLVVSFDPRGIHIS